MKIVRVLPEAPLWRPQISPEAGIWKPHICAVRPEVIFDPKQGNRAEPLVSSGRKCAGDQVFVERLEPSLIRPGYDHWRQTKTYSRSIACDFGKPHVVISSYGSLYPQELFAIGADDIRFQTLIHSVLVRFEGGAAIAAKSVCYPSLPKSEFLFHNFIGFSSSDEDFSGRVLSESPIDAYANILNLLR